MTTKSWMTTVSSLIAAGAAFVIFGQQQGYITPPHWLMGAAMFVFIGGLSSLGIAAKDAGVTGGTRGQPSTPEALAVANQAPSVVNPPVPTAPIVPPVVAIAAPDSTKEGKP